MQILAIRQCIVQKIGFLPVSWGFISIYLIVTLYSQVIFIWLVYHPSSYKKKGYLVFLVYFLRTKYFVRAKYIVFRKEVLRPNKNMFEHKEWCPVNKLIKKWCAEQCHQVTNIMLSDFPRKNIAPDIPKKSVTASRRTIKSTWVFAGEPLIPWLINVFPKRYYSLCQPSLIW